MFAPGTRIRWENSRNNRSFVGTVKGPYTGYPKSAADIIDITEIVGFPENDRLRMMKRGFAGWIKDMKEIGPAGPDRIEEMFS